jgi:hypothetical protein
MCSLFPEPIDIFHLTTYSQAFDESTPGDIMIAGSTPGDHSSTRPRKFAPQLILMTQGWYNVWE